MAHLRERVRAGEQVRGAMVFECFSPGVAQIMAHAGAEFVIYDMEHAGASHEGNAGALQDPDPDYSARESSAVPAELQPGDAVLYSGNVLHSGGRNETSEKWREAIHLSYVVGWLTPEESSPLDYTTAELEEAGASDHVMQVLGHRSCEFLFKSCLHAGLCKHLSPLSVPRVWTISGA